jgi:hypothetical protein
MPPTWTGHPPTLVVRSAGAAQPNTLAAARVVGGIDGGTGELPQDLPPASVT